jgi:S-DNA-T family DNA segregation ATPase FtsK/SpoIIIE
MDELSREWLDHQADQIEALLAAHKLDAEVIRVQVSPRWVRYALKLGMGTRITSVENLSEELAMTLEVEKVRMTRSGGALAVEAPLSDPQPVYLLSLIDEQMMLPPLTAVLGLSLEGDTFTLPFMAPEVTHVLVAGMTGSGKTELMRSMLLSMAIFNRHTALNIALIDPKQRGFGPLAELPHLMAPIVHAPDDAIELLESLVEEMERRDREDAPATPRIVVAVDEISDLITTGGKTVEKLLVRLAQRGREAGFHLIFSTQRPTADSIPSSIKANLPARLVGKVASAQESLNAAGIAAAGAESLVGSGDFIAIVGGRVRRFQAAYTGPADIRTIIDYLNTPVDPTLYSEVEQPQDEYSQW